MSGRAVARRVGLAVFAVYLVVSAMFVILTVSPDINLQRKLAREHYQNRLTDAELQDVKEEYLAVRGRNRPVLQRYANWLVDVTTLQWGYSFSRHRPVTAVIGTRLPYTLGYVVPAVVLAVVAGVAIGVYSATHQGTPLEALGRSSMYFGLGVPNFWLAEMAVFAIAAALGDAAVPSYPNRTLLSQVWGAALPALVLATGLVAGQVRFARANSMEYVGTEFVKLVRAKGAGSLRVARHVLRNAAIPLLSLFVTEMLGVLVLNIYVIEFAFGIPGFGRVSYAAIQDYDIALVLGTTMVLAFVGIGGTLLQDLAASTLDPRVDDSLYRAGVDAHRAVESAGRRLAGPLPNGVVYLLADPDRFFRRQRAGGFLAPAAVVVAAGVLALVPSLLVDPVVRAATPGGGVGAGVDALLGATRHLVRAVAAWVLLGGLLHVVAAALGGDGSLVETLRLAGWAWVPFLFLGVVSVAVTAAVLGAVQHPGSARDLTEFLVAFSRHPLFALVADLAVVATLWQAFLWLFAVRHAHDLEARVAGVVAATPTALVLWWNGVVVPWGLHRGLLEVPMLSWLLAGGGPV